MSSDSSEKPSDATLSQVIRRHVRSRSLIDTAEFVAEVLATANQPSAVFVGSSTDPFARGDRADTPRPSYARQLTYDAKNTDSSSPEDNNLPKSTGNSEETQGVIQRAKSDTTLLEAKDLSKKHSP